MKKVLVAAKLANADSFIRHLPQGYQTMVTSDGPTSPRDSGNFLPSPGPPWQTRRS